MKKWLLLLVLFSCNTDDKKKGLHEPIPERKVKEQFVHANRELAEREAEAMDQYARRRKMPFVTTPSGIRYFVYKPSQSGDSIREGMLVSMDYTLSLLDGTVCYSSDEDGRKSLIVGQEEAESGLHRGLQYLKRGDKAVIIIPSALAHGLLGDLKKIPPHMPIVYHVKTF